MSAPRILLTRPRADSAALAQDLAAQGWRPLIWPLIEIETIAPSPDLRGAQAVIFSSANAARRAAPAAITALCVGAATARAARDAGFADVRAADGDAAALVRLACDALSPGRGPVVFARGETVAADIAGALRAAGFTVREAALYAARPATDAPPEIAAALGGGGVAAAAFYSPRTAQAFARLAAPWRAGLGACAAVAISANAAAPLAALGFGRILTADSSDAGAMLRAIAAARPPSATPSGAPPPGATPSGAPPSGAPPSGATI